MAYFFAVCCFREVARLNMAQHVPPVQSRGHSSSFIEMLSPCIYALRIAAGRLAIFNQSINQSIKDNIFIVLVFVVTGSCL